MEMQSAGPLQVQIVGQGPPLLLVHGFPLDHRMWRGQLNSLSRAHQLLAPDLRGFGASAGQELPSRLLMTRHADDLASLLDALRIDVPVTLIGLSMGGYIGLEFWRRHRGRLDKLVLCDTKASADDEAAREGREAAARQALEGGVEAVAEAMLPKLLGPAAGPASDAARQARQMMLDVRPATLAAAQRGMAVRDDFQQLLPEIDCPCLLLCGQQDTITPPPVMQAMADRLPAAELRCIADAGHLAPLEKPAECNTAILDWLEQTAAPARPSP